MSVISWILLLCVLLVEGTITTVPLTLIFLLCLMVMKKAEWVFVLALFSGIVLDIFAVRPIGVMSIFFLLFIFFIWLYERKYEIATIPFVAAASFLGSFVFLHITGSANILETIISSFIAIAAFVSYQFIHKPALPAHLDYKKV